MKKFITILLIAGLAIPFTACGESSGNDKVEESETSQVKTSEQKEEKGTEKNDGDVEEVGDNVIQHYESESAKGKEIYYFKDDKLDSVSIEIAMKEGKDKKFEYECNALVKEGYEKTESKDGVVKFKAGKNLLKSLQVKHSSKADLLATLESQDNQ